MPRLEPGLRRALTAGNATALAVLLLLLAGLGVPRGGASAPAAALPAGDGGPTRRVLLIVVDGLRVDTAADPALMRQTAALAAARGLGTARVENLIPSTIAGITTLATGRPSPPLDFLSDFSAGPSADGGIFAAVARAGGRSFVAGPALWPQRYGRWIAASHAQAAVFGAPDGPLVDAALAALRTAGPDAYRLVVVHLSETDEAAHAHGIDSPGYRAAAGRADDAVGRLARAAGPETAVLITSDHGTTRAGGHAGPEPEVLATPLIALGPGLPSARGLTVRQRDVPALIAAAIGLPPFALVDDARAATRPPSIARYAGPAAVAAAVLAGLWFLTALAGDATGRPQGTALNVALWLALVLQVVDRPTAAIATAASALVIAAVSASRAGAAGLYLLVFPVAIGAVAGSLRLLDGVASCAAHPPALPVAAAVALALPPLISLWRLRRGAVAAAGHDLRLRPLQAAVGAFCCGTDHASVREIAPMSRRTRTVVVAALVLGLLIFLVGGPSLFAAGAAAFVIGRTLASLARGADADATVGWRWAAAGVALATAPPALARALGQTLSLSTIDVHAAFHLIAGPLGLPGAVVVTLLVVAAVPLALALGFGPAVGAASPRALGALAAGAGGALVGQAVVAAAVLHWPAAPQAAAALALGGGLRALFETFYLFAALSLARACAPRAATTDRPPCAVTTPTMRSCPGPVTSTPADGAPA